jgi:hypothetical protein
MIDKLWDDYHNEREKLGTAKGPFEYTDGKTGEAKVSLKAEEY